MAFWAAARFQPKHERLALQVLKLYGFETDRPRLRVPRLRQGRRVEIIAELRSRERNGLIELAKPRGLGMGSQDHRGTLRRPAWPVRRHAAA